MKISKIYENTFNVLEKGGKIYPIGTNKSMNTEIINMSHDFGSRPIIPLDNAFAIQFEQFGETSIYTLSGKKLEVIKDKLNLYVANSNASKTLFYNKSTNSYNYFSNNKLKDIGFYRRIDYSHKNVHFRIENLNYKIKISEFELQPEDTLRTTIVEGKVELNSGRSYLGNSNYLLIPTEDEILILNRERLAMQIKIKNKGSFALFSDLLYINSRDKITTYDIRRDSKTEYFKTSNQKTLFNGPIWVNKDYVVFIGVKENFVCIFNRNNFNSVSHVNTRAGIPNSKRSVKFIKRGIAVFDMDDNCYIINDE